MANTLYSFVSAKGKVMASPDAWLSPVSAPPSAVPSAALLLSGTAAASDVSFAPPHAVSENVIAKAQNNAVSFFMFISNTSCFLSKPLYAHSSVTRRRLSIAL